VPQPLVVDRADEDQGLELVPGVRVEHGLVAVFLVAVFVHLVGFDLHVEGAERGGVLASSAQGG
jgi:hypothetical protein